MVEVLRTVLSVLQIAIFIVMTPALLLRTRAAQADTVVPEEKLVKAATQVTDFTAQDASGATVKVEFDKYRGRPVVLYFWIAPNKEDMRDLQGVLEYTQKHPALQLVVIAFHDEVSPRLRQALEDGRLHLKGGERMRFAFLEKNNPADLKEYERLEEYYQLHWPYPNSLFVNTKGEILFTRDGYLLWNSSYMEQRLKELE